MKEKVYFITGKHAFASRSYSAWLKGELEGKYNADVTVIDHINPSFPILSENLQLLNQYDFNNSHILTHSLGAPTFLNWLKSHDVKIKTLTMLAPASPGTNHGSRNSEWLKTSGYIGENAKINPTAILPKIAKRPTIIYSENDQTIRVENFKKLADLLGGGLIEDPGKDHFFGYEGDNPPEFDIILKSMHLTGKKEH